MTLTENLLIATLQSLKQDYERGNERTSEKRFVGIQADSWIGPDQLVVGGERFHVKECRSPLAVRAAMDELKEGDPRLVVVTPCPGAELGNDVEARVVGNRFKRADPWQAVLSRFGARRAEPGVPRDHWLRDLLLSVPERDLPRLPTSDVLDLETVRGVVFFAIGLEGRIDHRSLLAWAGSEPARTFRSRPVELQQCVRQWIEELLGKSASAVVDCELTNLGDKAKPLGLVLRVLIEGSKSPGNGRDALIKAEARLERFLGTRDVATTDLIGWVEATEESLRSDLDAERGGEWKLVLDEADRLLHEFGVLPLAHLSSCLATGLVQREEQFAAAVDAALANSTTELAEVERAARAVRDHVLAVDLRKGRHLALPMALRLLRWLRTDETTANDFRSLALAYGQDGSFVDWAREMLDYPEPAQPALRRLWVEVTARREKQSQRFAEASLGHFAAPSDDGLLIPLEQVLDRVLGPLAKHVPILLLVLDGMSLAVFHEILSGLASWSEIGPCQPDAAAGVRRYGVAVLPTTTEVSRTSLLCGKVVLGNQDLERATFAEHPALQHGKQKPVLIHKGSLTSGRMGLDAEVLIAIGGSEGRVDRAPRIVGVVVNAIDDWLSKGDQDAAPWTAERIKPLPDLLQCASTSGRAVVITSDHGHVREHTTRQIEAMDGSRHRRPGPTREGELRVRGPRVGMFGGEIVVPWTETLRYTGAKQHGYHGGISPQEVLVPLSVFVRPGTEVEGYAEVPVQQPSWWDAPGIEAKQSRAAAITPTKGTGKKPKVQPSVLPFEGKRGDLVAALLESKLYQAQNEAAGKMRVPDERAAGVLRALAERGGSLTLAALSARLALPLPRVNTLLTAVRRLLNLDGVEALAVDSASSTVKVDWDTLRLQFDLGGSP